MAGRKTKLTPALQKQLVKLLKTGVTVRDACAHLDISEKSYYEWLQRGEADETPFREFREAVIAAHNDAKITAIGTLRGAMSPYRQTTKSTEKYTETRVNKITGELYDYVEKREKKTVTLFAGDWRAAVEYLKRRHPDEWTEHVQVDDWRTEAINLIRRGELQYAPLAEEVGIDLAAELFKSAGIAVVDAGAFSTGAGEE